MCIRDSANAIEPRKRMLSSMTPTIVRKDGEPVLLVGGVGGSRIITATLQVLLNVLEHGMNAQDAVNAPRIHHQWQPDTLYLERGISSDTAALLESKGHRVERNAGARSVTGAIHIRRGKSGTRYEGAADPRRRATAVGY